MVVALYRFTSRFVDDKRGVVFGYDEEGWLVKVEVHARLSHVQQKYIWNNVPLHQDGLQVFSESSSSIEIKKIEMDLSFERFWFSYYERTERKAGSKIKCEKIWNRLSKMGKLQALDYMEVYKRFLRTNPHIQKLYAETFLTRKEWENG